MTTESIDLLEEMAGWNAETLLTIRVMLSSLLNKIRTTASLLRAMRGNVAHPSWPALFQALVMIEHFMFYSALPPGGGEKPPPVPPSQVRGTVSTQITLVTHGRLCCFWAGSAWRQRA